MTGVVSHWRKLTVCLLFAGCGRSATGTAERARAELHSWEATRALLEEEAARGAVPADFARQVRQVAEEESRKAEEERRKAEAQGGRVSAR